ARIKKPLAIAQTGKAIRNEIVARQFLFSMKEFEQMEMQFFVRPGEEMQWYDTWKEKRLKWHHAMGFGENKYRFHNHLKLAHYANAACDIEFQFPFGFKEIEGIHSRTDFDLSAHEKFSGKKLHYFDPELNKSYVPYIIETSIGLDRMFLAVLSSSFEIEKLASEKAGEEGTERVVLKMPPALAPVKVAVFPLVKKDGLPEKAMEIFNNLKQTCRCYYEEKDTIGKRYRRQDAIGTPFCITVDYQSLQDNSVTIRYRDNMEQERIPVEKISHIVEEKVSLRNLLSNL
ncbi:MAG: glycine--tRNA ligase, partial [Bacteroidota bacterium]